MLSASDFRGIEKKKGLKEKKKTKMLVHKVPILVPQTSGYAIGLFHKGCMTYLLKNVGWFTKGCMICSMIYACFVINASTLLMGIYFIFLEKLVHLEPIFVEHP